MTQRYHLELAALALGLGVLIAAIGWFPGPLARRVLALCGATAAAIAGWSSPRGLPWVVAALALCLPADDELRPHPFGRFTPILVVVTLVGVWSAVPDTEAPLAAAAVLLPISAVFLAVGRAPGPVGAASLLVAVAGSVWTGSAGWGSAMATVGAVGLIATLPLLTGYATAVRGRTYSALVVMQVIAGLGLPRTIMSRSVPVAVGVVLVVNALLLGAAAILLRNATPPVRGRSPVGG